MESFARTAAGIFIAATVTAAAASGSFALVGGTQHAFARAIITRPSATSVSLSITQSRMQGGPAIRSYQIDMTKLMHMIAISDDFQTFMHVHPAYNRKAGTFRQTLDVNPAHTYYVYVDSQPRGMSQQVFRFTVPAAAGAQEPSKPLGVSTPSPRAMASGSYTVALARTTLAAHAMNMLPVEITQDGKPADDLTPYLGAAGHAVFINTSTLDYVHVHPMIRAERTASAMPMGDDDMGKAGAHLLMHVPALPAGTYKLWFQFEGAGALHTVPFTIVVR